MMPSYNGDKGYLNFVLNRLEGALPGLPIPAGLIMHYERNCETVAQVDDRAGYPTRYITERGLDGLHFKHLLTMESAAYCVLHDITLLDAGRDTRLFSQRKGFKKEISDIMGCFPDLKDQLKALRQAMERSLPEPGSVYMTLDLTLHPRRISTDDKGNEGFTRYLYEEMRKVVPGEPLPDMYYLHYDFPDIAGLRYIPGEDMDNYFTKRMVDGMNAQCVSHPKQIIHLHEIMYKVQNNIPLFASVEAYVPGWQKYFEECKQIRRCAPDISAKLDKLQELKVDEPVKSRRVPSIPVKSDKKQGPKL